MRYVIFLFCSIIFLLPALIIKAQSAKFDSSGSFGNLTYNVSCNNKHVDENTVSIVPKGFKAGMQNVQLSIKGRLRSIVVDDLNNDGYPDLLLIFYSGLHQETGNVMGIASRENTSLVPIIFPDIYNDPALREGYKGQDKFEIVIGLLQRSFPVYKPGDTATPSGGTKVIQYKIIDEKGGLSFKVLRTYEK